jgi:hypothetical protein
MHWSRTGLTRDSGRANPYDAFVDNKTLNHHLGARTSGVITGNTAAPYWPAPLDRFGYFWGIGAAPRVDGDLTHMVH